MAPDSQPAAWRFGNATHQVIRPGDVTASAGSVRPSSNQIRHDRRRQRREQHAVAEVPGRVDEPVDARRRTDDRKTICASRDEDRRALRGTSRARPPAADRTPHRGDRAPQPPSSDRRSRRLRPSRRPARCRPPTARRSNRFPRARVRAAALSTRAEGVAREWGAPTPQPDRPASIRPDQLPAATTTVGAVHVVPSSARHLEPVALARDRSWMFRPVSISVPC